MKVSLGGFIEFIRVGMSVPVDVLPDGSIYIRWAYARATHLVNRQIQQADPLLYMVAVYNLGADILVNITQDAPDAPPYKDGLPYWKWLRSQFNINAFIAGVVTSSSDEGTSQSLEVSDAFKNLTLMDLQNLKTPWGREYLGIAQSVGALFGMS